MKFHVLYNYLCCTVCWKIECELVFCSNYQHQNDWFGKDEVEANFTASVVESCGIFFRIPGFSSDGLISTVCCFRFMWRLALWGNKLVVQ